MSKPPVLFGRMELALRGSPDSPVWDAHTRRAIRGLAEETPRAAEVLREPRWGLRMGSCMQRLAGHLPLRPPGWARP